MFHASRVIVEEKSLRWYNVGLYGRRDVRSIKISILAYFAAWVLGFSWLFEPDMQDRE